MKRAVATLVAGFAVVGIAAVSLAACGPPSERTPWPVAGESSSPGATDASASGGLGAPEFVRQPSEPFVPESRPSTNQNGTAGSGCAPGSGGLPDGLWRGLIEDADSEGIEFDLLCSWAFDSNTYRTEIAKHEPGDGPIIYVTKNDNPLTRDVPFAPELGVWPVRAGPQAGGIGDFLEARNAGGWREAWIFVNGGVITEISEVYYP